MATTTHTTSTSTSASIAAADAKITADLSVLREKMDLLEGILDPPDAASPKLSVNTNDAVRSVVGYLDACGPRMIELVNTVMLTTHGVLSESIVEEVLGCNDRLQKLLSDVDTRAMVETPASTTVASASASENSAADGADGSTANANANANTNALAAAAAASTDLTEQFGDLLLGSNEDDHFLSEAHSTATSTTTTTAGAKTTGETSDDFHESKQPPASEHTPSASNAVAAAAAAESDPFDDFFAERTTDSTSGF